MSGYTVVWEQDAVDELAELWMKAPDRTAIAKATAEIDASLLERPERKGQAVAEGLRKLVCRPLTAFYSVRPADRTVEIAMVAISP